MSGRPSSVAVERLDPAIAVVRVFAAGKYSTLTIEVLDALTDAFAALSSSGDVRAVVLTSEAGTSFAAGADLREVAGLQPREALGFAARGRQLFGLIERIDAVVLAAIAGYCMGGGLDLAIACDVRHASPRSVFAHPGAKLGILTGFGGTAKLPRLIGKALSLELFATGRSVSAAEALAIGLVDRVSDDPFGSSMDLARKAAGFSAEHLARLKAVRDVSWRRRVSILP